MDSVREQILLLISTPFYMVIIGLEVLLSNYRHKKAYTWKDTFTNVYLMLMNGLLDLLLRGFYLAVLGYAWQHRLMEFNQVWVYWIMLFAVEDFLYYWLHRFDHEIRLFWAVHVTHHSSEHMNFSVGFRSSVFQPLYRFIYFLPLGFMGFKPVDIFFVYSATQIWGIFVHTELIQKMGWLEHILVTPSHHRVHHASNAKYLDKNMGMFLIIWDKLFGTFQAELPEHQYEPIRYGLTKPIEQDTPGKVIFHEWKDIWTDLKRTDIGWRDKLGYLFAPPGWSHDGSRKTSDEMRRMEEADGGTSPAPFVSKELADSRY
jgi:sterol desaturase/sphingolipid hydroxylase (fatty acid hydroxylase superfamily)